MTGHAGPEEAAPGARTPRLLLADADVLGRAGIRRVVRAAGFDVRAEVADAPAAVRATREHVLDLCLVDLRLPGGALDAVEAIAGQVGAPTVVVLGGAEGEEDLIAALDAGADGYLRKDMETERLPATLLGLLEGEAAVPRRHVAGVVRELRRRRRGAGGAVGPAGIRLSEREAQVLELLGAGLGTAAMADRLGISPVTVRRHVAATVQKLGVADREAAVRLLRREA